jgi:hypothetical protein
VNPWAAQLLLVIDVNVPERLTEAFVDRGHSTVIVRRMIGGRALDKKVAALADELGGVVVTWDKDFTQIIARTSRVDRQRFRRAGCISFVGCSYHIGAARALRLMPSIEFEHAQVQRERDKRLIMTIRSHSFTVER